MVSISGWNWKTRVAIALQRPRCSLVSIPRSMWRGNVPSVDLFLLSLVQTQNVESAAQTRSGAGGAFCPRLPLLVQRQRVPKGKSRSPWKRKEIFENRATQFPHLPGLCLAK